MIEKKAISVVSLLISCACIGSLSNTTYAANNGSSHQPNRYSARIAYAPVGLVVPITLSTAISTQVTQAGDTVEARVSRDVQLGNAHIPAGSRVKGVITDATAAKRLGKSGHLGIKFTQLITPNGASYPLSAHLVGGLEKYHTAGPEGSDQFRGETGMTKLKAAGVRSLIGAGGGAVLGTAVGGIAGGGRGAGRGAWSGTAIGAGLGAADSLLLRKGREINLKSGTAMQLQLDSPLSIAEARPSLY